MKSTIRHGLLAGLVVPVALVAPADLSAHPPVSVVIAPNGRVFFSDLERIWVLERDGELRVVVRGVHSHELWLGEDGLLYGDDVQNEGDAYRFRTWRLRADGRAESATEWREGHPRDLGYSLTEPADGGRYWAVGSGGEIRLIDAEGHLHASIPLGTDPVAPSWVVGEGPSALVVQGGRLWRVSAEGGARTLADDLIVRTDDFDWLHDRHALMKPWTDSTGRIYVPVYAGQCVVRLERDGGLAEVVVTSETGWSPVGGAFDSDGSLWLLEWSGRNQARLRHIPTTGEERVYGPA